MGREDLCRLRIAQLTALAYYLGYEVTLSNRPNPRYTGRIRLGERIGVWAKEPERQLTTLAHEICHAGLWDLRVPSPFVELSPGGRLEEALCYAFEAFMVGVLLDRWPSSFRATDVYVVQYFLSRFVEQLRLRLLHRCLHLTRKKARHERALELANAIRDSLQTFNTRWRDGRYAGIRDAATDVFEYLFDLVDLCNGLIEGKKAEPCRDEEGRESLFQELQRARSTM
jgi:hypothetical protein